MTLPHAGQAGGGLAQKVGPVGIARQKTCSRSVTTCSDSTIWTECLNPRQMVTRWRARRRIKPVGIARQKTCSRSVTADGDTVACAAADRPERAGKPRSQDNRWGRSSSRQAALRTCGEPSCRRVWRRVVALLRATGRAKVWPSGLDPTPRWTGRPTLKGEEGGSSKIRVTSNWVVNLWFIIRYGNSRSRGARGHQYDGSSWHYGAKRPRLSRLSCRNFCSSTAGR